MPQEGGSGSGPGPLAISFEKVNSGLEDLKLEVYSCGHFSRMWPYLSG